MEQWHLDGLLSDLICMLPCCLVLSSPGLEFGRWHMRCKLAVFAKHLEEYCIV